MGKILDKMTSLYTATKFLKLVETLGSDIPTTFAHMFRYTVLSSVSSTDWRMSKSQASVPAPNVRPTT